MSRPRIQKPGRLVYATADSSTLDEWKQLDLKINQKRLEIQRLDKRAGVPTKSGKQYYMCFGKKSYIKDAEHLKIVKSLNYTIYEEQIAVQSKLFKSGAQHCLLIKCVVKLNIKTMEIIALAYKIKAKSDFDKSVLYAFLNPAWAGNHVVEIELSITRNDLLDLFDKSLVSDSYKEAHKKAYLRHMSEEDYNFFYDQLQVIYKPFSIFVCFKLIMRYYTIYEQQKCSSNPIDIGLSIGNQVICVTFKYTTIKTFIIMKMCAKLPLDGKNLKFEQLLMRCGHLVNLFFPTQQKQQYQVALLL